ncbi:TET7 [Linum perenne]
MQKTMVWLTNCIFSFLNILIMTVGVVITATAGIMQLTEHGSDCHKFLEMPLLMIGSFMVFISIVGLIGSCCKLKPVLWIYSFLSFLMILAAMGFIAFAFLVTNTSAGKMVSEAGYDHYRLEDYSNWLRVHFADAEHWRKIKSCMVEADVCDEEDRNRKSLSILQPPDDCKFVESGNGKWKQPSSSSPNTKDPDCTTWSNDPRKRCFDCESCKAGALDNIRKDWRTLLVVVQGEQSSLIPRTTKDTTILDLVLVFFLSMMFFCVLFFHFWVNL